jgi:hypothetical protein
MAVLYVVATWLGMQAAEVPVGLADLPEWIGRAALLFAWHTRWPSASAGQPVAVPGFESMGADPVHEYGPAAPGGRH